MSTADHDNNTLTLDDTQEIAKKTKKNATEYIGMRIETVLMKVKESTGIPLRDPQGTAAVMADIGQFPQEAFFVITLNTKKYDDQSPHGFTGNT